MSGSLCCCYSEQDTETKDKNNSQQLAVEILNRNSIKHMLIRVQIYIDLQDEQTVSFFELKVGKSVKFYNYKE
jgi:hypothetical protein